MSTFKDLITALSFPRLYLQLGKTGVRSILSTYCVAILALQGVSVPTIFNLYALMMLAVATVMFLS